MKLRNKFYYVGLLGLGLAGGQDLGFGFREMVGFPAPSGDLEPAINMHPVKARERAEKPAGA